MNYKYFMEYVLIVDDDSLLRETLCDIFECMNFHCRFLNKIQEINDCIIQNGQPKFAFIDHNLSCNLAEEIIPFLKNTYCKIKVILMTGVHNSENIAKSLNVDFLLKKPFGLYELEYILNN